MEKVRNVLYTRPDDRHWWRDRVDEDVADELWAWADALIRDRFPELH